MAIVAPEKGALDVSRFMEGHDTDAEAVEAAQRWYQDLGWKPVASDQWRVEQQHGSSRRIGGWAIPPRQGGEQDGADHDRR